MRLRERKVYLPPPLENSAMQAPKVIFFPQQVDPGFSSISFTYAENTLPT